MNESKSQKPEDENGSAQIPEHEFLIVGIGASAGGVARDFYDFARADGTRFCQLQTPGGLRFQTLRRHQSRRTERRL